MRDSHRPVGGGLRGRLAVWCTAAAVFCGAGLVGCSSGDGASNSASPSAASHSQRGPSHRPAHAWNTSPQSIAALGDSITRAFDACTVLSDCPRASWATGTDPAVNSLARRLLKSPARHSWNLARTGARMADLPQQMAAAVSRKPDLVTVMLGANDACRDTVAAMTPVADFRATFDRSLKQLRQALPKTQVYVASVPDLRRVWAQGRSNPRGKQVWSLGICASMLSRPDDMDAAAVARRRQVYDRVVAYNTALKEVCGRDPLCRYDGGDAFRYLFSTRQLSTWDWFHPSKQGQERLAELAYRRVTSAAP